VQRRLIAALVAAASLGGASSAGAQAFPDRLDLPDGWQPEGIAAGRGTELLVGSIPTGDIWRFDARTGQGRRLIDAPDGSAAIGIKADADGRLFVAGGPTGRGFVYDLRTRRRIASFQFAPNATTFVNDVALAGNRAYFTDSRRDVLYVVNTRRLGGFRELRLRGFQLDPAGFNLNGIVASPNGRTLLAIHSPTGVLWRIDARTGRSTRVAVRGEALTNGDGLLLSGRTLYVVRNRLNQVAVVRLRAGYRRGRLASTIAPSDVDVPTTIARVRGRLYVVNARFGLADDATATADYWVTQVHR